MLFHVCLLNISIYVGSFLIVQLLIQEQLKENIIFFTKNECEIIVTATRTKGGSVDELALFKNELNAELIWIEKKDNPNLNKLVAADIFRRIIDEVYPKAK